MLRWEGGNMNMTEHQRYKRLNLPIEKRRNINDEMPSDQQINNKQLKTSATKMCSSFSRVLFSVFCIKIVSRWMMICSPKEWLVQMLETYVLLFLLQTFDCVIRLTTEMSWKKWMTPEFFGCIRKLPLDLLSISVYDSIVSLLERITLAKTTAPYLTLLTSPLTDDARVCTLCWGAHFQSLHSPNVVKPFFIIII